jgi:hypothetical protein
MMLGTLALFTLVAAQRAPAPLVTPHWKKEPLGIEGVRVLTEVPRQYEVAELEVDLTATYDNPFDPRDVALDAVMTMPSGRELSVAGFLYRPHTRSLADGREVVSPDGPPVWRVRLTPIEKGDHTVQLRLRDRQGTVERAGITLQAAPANAKGFVRVSPRDHRYFEFSGGGAYYPIGANTATAGPRGTFDFDDWFAGLGRARANYARVWLGPAWATHALETFGKREEGRGMGQFDLANAWRLDHTLERAREHGLYLMLTLDSYHSLRHRDRGNLWERTPHNDDFGGPLRIWSDFWTSAEMERLYEAKLRYIVARYGAHPNVFAWELWNKADLVTDFSMPTVRDWHVRAASKLRSIDPYDHLIATSFSDTMGVKDISTLPAIDINLTHHFGMDPSRTVAVQQSRKAAWTKPHFFAEVGADPHESRAAQDPAGLQFRDPIWASIATGASGGAMPWWTEELVHGRDLYDALGAAARFVADIDWPNERFRQAAPRIAFQQPPATPLRRDIWIEGPVTWTLDAFNKPRTVTVTEKGVSGGPVAGLQHGVRNHRNRHNPVLFRTNFPRKTRFVVEVGDVSGEGGAKMVVSLNGHVVMTRDFRDEEPLSTDPIRKYRGAYGFDLPPGQNSVKVENLGNDWFEASYRFVDAAPRTAPPLVGWAITGERTAAIWLRHEDRNWRRIARNEPTPPAPPTTVALTGLAAGAWNAELWDTGAGRVVSTRTITVGMDGIARIPVPAIAHDLAIKMRVRSKG